VTNGFLIEDDRPILSCL